jgi:hypothetical protein
MNNYIAWFINKVQVKIIVSHITFLVEGALKKLESFFVIRIDDTDPVSVSDNAKVY